MEQREASAQFPAARVLRRGDGAPPRIFSKSRTTPTAPAAASSSAAVQPPQQQRDVVSLSVDATSSIRALPQERSPFESAQHQSVPDVLERVVSEGVAQAVSAPRRPAGPGRAFPEATRRPDGAAPVLGRRTQTTQSQHPQHCSLDSATGGPEAQAADAAEDLGRENERKVAAMTDEQRREHLDDIAKSLSPEAIAALRARALRRKAKEAAARSQPARPEDDDPALEWTKDVVPPTVVPKPSSLPVDKMRFGFAGEAVDPSADVPEASGLYHHGDDAWAAGYTLAEIAGLLRSTVPAQRSAAATVLGRLALNAKSGVFGTGRTCKGVLREMVQTHYVPLLLRVALDDPQSGVVVAALGALRALLVDGRALAVNGALELCHRGLEMASLAPPALAEAAKDSDDNQQPTDVEVLANDVVTGLLNAGLLNRLRYLLEVSRIAGTARTILEIVLHCCRHSAQSAEMVYKCPRLVECLKYDIISSAAAEDSHEIAFEIVRVLCQASKSICKDLWESGVVKACLTSASPSLLLDPLRALMVCATYRLAAPQALFEWMSELRVDAGLSLFLAECVVPLRAHTQDLCEEALAIVSSTEPDIASLSSAFHFIAACVEAKVVDSAFLDRVANAVFGFMQGSLFQSLADICSNEMQFIPCGETLRSLPSTVSAGIPTPSKTTLKLLLVAASALSGFYRLLSAALRSPDKSISRVEECVERCESLLVQVLRSFPATQRGDNARVACYVQRPVFHMKHALVKCLEAYATRRHAIHSRESALPALLFDAGLKLVPDVPPGDEVLLGDIGASVLFHPPLFATVTGAPAEEADELCALFLAFLSGNVASSREVEESLQRLGASDKLESLFYALGASVSLLPLERDWVALPVVLRKATGTDAHGTDVQSQTLSQYAIRLVLYVLGRADALSYVQYVGPSVFLFRAMQSLLLPDVYEAEREALSKILDAVCGMGGSFRLSDTAESIVSELVTRYSSDSFGEPVFSKYISLLFLMKGSPSLRRLAWSELSSVIDLVFSAPLPLPLDCYLEPLESDEKTLDLITDALRSTRIAARRGSVGYWLAVHHVSGSVFRQSRTTTFVGKQRLLAVLRGGNAEVLRDVLSYVPPHTDGGQPAEPGKALAGFAAAMQTDVVRELLREDHAFAEAAQKMMAQGN
eukprot:m51a1_g2592 hypothetical protein (1156) ;mRNA; r:432702-437171